MIERKSFIRGAIVGLTALVATPKLIKADEPINDPTEAELEAEASKPEDALWPNEKPFPCRHFDCADSYYDADCHDCRTHHNVGVVRRNDQKNMIAIGPDGRWSIAVCWCGGTMATGVCPNSYRVPTSLGHWSVTHPTDDFWDRHNHLRGATIDKTPKW